MGTSFALTVKQRMQNAQPFILVLIDADADDYIVSCLVCFFHTSVNDLAYASKCPSSMRSS